MRHDAHAAAARRVRLDISLTQSSACIRFAQDLRPEYSSGAAADDEVKLGINLWSQASDWPSFLDAGRRAEALGYDHLWTWDHIYAIFGDPYQPIHEGYTALAALAQATDRIRLGLFVGANTFRNPGLAVKAVTTIDHISGGRAIMGIGGAWFELEHDGLRDRLRRRLRAAARLARRGGAGDSGAARRRRGHERAGRALRVRPPADRATARPGRTCRS